MSIFGSIVSRIFGHRDANAAPPPSADPIPTTGPASAGAVPTQAAPSTAPQQAEPVDVAAILTEMAGKAPQKLDWQHSIVDLMKLLGLDSGLEARRELARELQYGGSTEDSATMNIWLHQQVMTKLAENGGKVPDALKV